jgi:hypothetical protein
VVVTRPGLVHAPGMTVTRTAMAALPASLKGVGVQELAAVSLDVAVRGGEGGKVLENAELAARGSVLFKAELMRNK